MTEQGPTPQVFGSPATWTAAADFVGRGWVMSWGKVGSACTYGLHAVEKRIDALKRGIKYRFDLFDPICILPYGGYGNRERWHIQGRVLEELGIAEPSEDASWWRNTRAMTRRFTSDEIPFVRLRARFGDQSWEGETDDEGYFAFTIEPREFDVDKLWHDVHFELLDQVVKGQDSVTAVGQVVVPPPEAEFGVISDIDDTVLHSRATDLWRLMQLTFAKNSRTRVALPGVPSFYRALQRGTNGQAANPFFYVSSSAWNIYDALEDFIRFRDIPRGPILLRDLGLDKNKFIKTGHEHKLEKIRQIMETCHSIPFVLIGDAGQHDPQLYAEVVKEYPERVVTIYIRDVSWRDRSKQIDEIAEGIKQHNPEVEMRLVQDTEAAAEHAAQLGLIAAESVAGIREECRQAD